MRSRPRPPWTALTMFMIFPDSAIFAAAKTHEFTAARSGAYAPEPGADRVRQIFVCRRISIRIGFLHRRTEVRDMQIRNQA
jgi:hypothetical protein